MARSCTASISAGTRWSAWERPSSRGCEIGEECLVAAGALVTEGRRIPPRSLVIGMPAKVLRAVTPEEIEKTRTIGAHYLEMAQRYVRGGHPAPWLRLGNP